METRWQTVVSNLVKRDAPASERSCTGEVKRIRAFLWLISVHVKSKTRMILSLKGDTFLMAHL
jgi:hypothetical protein